MIQPVVIKIVIPFILVLIGVLINYLSNRMGLPPDNPIEQLSEKIIEDSTGIRIDFSPERRK